MVSWHDLRPKSSPKFLCKIPDQFQNAGLFKGLEIEIFSHTYYFLYHLPTGLQLADLDLQNR